MIRNRIENRRTEAMMVPATICAALASLALVLAISAEVAAQMTGRDEVVMADRTRLRNVTVIAENWDEVLIDTTGDGNVDRTVPTSEVTRVEYGDTPPAWRRGDTHYRAGRFSAAADEFEKAMEAQGVRDSWRKPHGLFNLGRCYLEMGRAEPDHLDKAISNFREVIEEHPKARTVPDSIHGLATAYVAKGQQEDAQNEFMKLESGEYGEEWQRRARMELASLMAERRDFDAALEFAQGALELAEESGQDENIFDARVAYYETLAKAGRGDEAYQSLQDMAAEFPEHAVSRKARIYNALGDALMSQDRVHEAVLAYLRVQVLYFEASEQLPRAMYSAALAFRTQQQGERARRLARELMEKFPENKWAHMARQEFPDLQ